MRDWDKTVISQFANSTTLVQLLDDYNQNVDPASDFQEFYDKIWNLDTAEGYGLDVWGRIVGVNRVLTVVSDVYLGFSGPTGASGDTFNTAIFYSGQPMTSNYTLADHAYRQLILAKAAANITDGSIPSINRILRLLFPDRGDCYVRDNLDMTCTYVFDFSLEAFEIAIVTTSGVLPTPTGVLANVSHL